MLKNTGRLYNLESQIEHRGEAGSHYETERDTTSEEKEVLSIKLVTLDAHLAMAG